MKVRDINSLVRQLLSSSDLQPELPPEEARKVASWIGELTRLDVYERSISAAGETIVFIGKQGTSKYLGVLSRGGNNEFEGEKREVEVGGEKLVYQQCETSHRNAVVLRRQFPFTAPRPLGLTRSAGFGDRLGVATPGHLRAARKHTLAPMVAQQSIREMTRTERTPDQVMDDATWGVLQEGWRAGYGADADHLKTPEDIDRCVAAGFTFYTIDPSAYVDNAADTDSVETLRSKVQSFSQDVLQTTPDGLKGLYLGKPFHIGQFTIEFDEMTLLRASAKYSAAVGHTARMYRYLDGKMEGRPFELEMSVDETDTPTTVQEHFFVASELKRLGVKWVSLAPRFIGRMEKGVDYIGDLDAFEEELIRHVEIARRLGPYKLSLHSGSDKFSIYPLFAKHAGELFHLKTAGTSYLEALRAISRIDPALFREIFAFSRGRYEEDRATYHVSADLSRVPEPEELDERDPGAILDAFDSRQVLHVTFGSVLTARTDSGEPRFRERILAALKADEETHYEVLQAHFERHLAPFDR